MTLERLDGAGGDACALVARGLSKTFGGSAGAATAWSLSIAPGEIHALLGENGSGQVDLHQDPVRLPPARTGWRGAHRRRRRSRWARRMPRTPPAAGSCTRTSAWWSRRRPGQPVPQQAASRRGSAPSGAARRGAGAGGAGQGRPRRRPAPPVASLTPALKTGVAVARALLADPARAARLLVLDEPTATLAGQRGAAACWRSCAGWRPSGVGVLYVTHRLDEVFELAHNVTVLRDGPQGRDDAGHRRSTAGAWSTCWSGASSRRSTRRPRRCAPSDGDGRC